MIYISSGKFQAAIDLLIQNSTSIERMEIRDAFNYAMAVWGNECRVEVALFEQVVELENSTDSEFEDANYAQCLAIASWAIGNVDSAIEFAEQARKEAQTEPQNV